MTFPAEVRLAPFDFAYRPAPLQVLPPLDTSHLYFVKHDFEMPAGSLQRLGVPETVRVLTSNDYVTPFNESFQKYAYSLLVSNAPSSWTKAQLWNAWGHVYESNRFITNFAGVDNCRDYIRDLRMDRPLPKVIALTCGGNVVWVEGDEVTKGGRKYRKVRMLDGSKAAPSRLDVNRETAPWLVHVATTVNLNDKTKVGAFPQLDGRDVCFAFVARDPSFNYILSARLVPLEGGLIPSPYTV